MLWPLFVGIILGGQKIQSKILKQSIIGSSIFLYFFLNFLLPQSIDASKFANSVITFLYQYKSAICDGDASSGDNRIIIQAFSTGVACLFLIYTGDWIGRRMLIVKKPRD
jgi:hypothetical protein